jgi:hypothetical protein
MIGPTPVSSFQRKGSTAGAGNGPGDYKSKAPQERAFASAEDVVDVLNEIGKACGWAFLSALFMGFGTGLGVKFFDIATPGLDEMEELRKGNVAVAIVVAAVIVAIGFVMGSVLSTPSAIPGS